MLDRNGNIYSEILDRMAVPTFLYMRQTCLHIPFSTEDQTDWLFELSQYFVLAIKRESLTIRQSPNFCSASALVSSRNRKWLRWTITPMTRCEYSNSPLREPKSQRPKKPGNQWVRVPQSPNKRAVSSQPHGLWAKEPKNLRVREIGCQRTI